MRRISQRTLWGFSAITLVSLVLIAVAGVHVTSSYSKSMQWVAHTRRVELAIEEARSNLMAAELGRFDYVFAGQPDGLRQYQASADALPAQLNELRSLTVDNPKQQSLVAEITPQIERELATLRVSTEMKTQGASTEAQEEYSATGRELSRSIFAKLQSLRMEEERLLALRRVVSEQTYRTQETVLTVSFGVVFLLTLVSFLELIFQLRERQNAEEVVRRLSGRILQVQDEERRKLARDLHDGIGQIFAGLKMSLARAAQSPSLPAATSEALFEALQLVDDGLNQSRTLSYLLHPPMLDEVGFAAAAKWLVNGFAERSRIPVNSEIPSDLNLPREVELTLFRILQEALTNIHRHSQSAHADVLVGMIPGAVLMSVRDYGKGIPDEVLQNFKTSKAPAGVGLAGMRGRVSDLNGSLELENEERGTSVRVCIPIKAPVEASAPCPPASQPAPQPHRLNTESPNPPALSFSKRS